MCGISGMESGTKTILHDSAGKGVEEKSIIEFEYTPKEN